MLTLAVKISESYDDSKHEIVPEFIVVQLEHSLVSLSKWESFFKKPFITTDKSTKETLWYVNAMILTPDLPVDILSKLSEENLDAIREYISDPMTATWFSNNDKSTSREIITAEIIYYWMISQSIPMECQHWHLNRLLTLVKVCIQKNSPEKKMSRTEAAAQRRSLNAKRREQFGSKG